VTWGSLVWTVNRRIRNLYYDSCHIRLNAKLLVNIHVFSIVLLDSLGSELCILAAKISSRNEFRFGEVLDLVYAPREFAQ
jgi:hypothetical protein